MSANQLHRFHISYKLNGNIHLDWIEGINLRHAKEKIEFSYPEATDLMDWTYEKDAELRHFLRKSKMAIEKFSEQIRRVKEVDELQSLSASSH